MSNWLDKGVMLMNDVKYVAKRSKRPDGWYAEVIREGNGVTETVFEKKCLNEDVAAGIAGYELKRRLQNSRLVH
ncbi:hypothetical protein M3212_20995 [Alkalihalobacillus oceani]|uniref:hypothetical protein n=1 Tax=Halalkalibacter oceani TaxID=1653776 RepID=UPI002041EEAD|nr:hypothetical protein [Halalkalibacter oceani]MCM3763194.1 hypothetical protein [Halalkalibacter oceani]